ncbi:MAG: 50S ribosomal protein L29 [Myxococcales bacterium]|nr:MAG: 50S ribosomal protein L29 [Myxococcales bacterium]
MKFEEIKERSTDDLEGLEKELRRELWQARFANATNQLEDTAKIKRLRRDIARAKTLKTQRLSQSQANEAGQ